MQMLTMVREVMVRGMLLKKNYQTDYGSKRKTFIQSRQCCE